MLISYWRSTAILCSFALPTLAQEKIDYLRQVRPILTQHCYACHGPDAEERKADLRLDLRDEMTAVLEDDLRVVTAGDLDKSELWLRITTDDEDDVMPPPKAKNALSAEQKEILRRWIEEGASWAEHWAFTAPVRPELPKAGEDWSHNSIDRFVAAHHATASVEPSDPADKAALIRRLSFDLTGMPPSPDEIEAFVADKKPDAYERLVDRLLASKRYGEHQAQHWLDLARYADTNGYQRDSGREAWKWREWVIEAFNENMPYDQFAVEQLAGDLLEKPTLEQKIATGFNRNHSINSEAGEEPDEYRTKYVMDRVDTTATTFLGLTVACAQCHDHKFDPISQRDYYRFYAFFNQVEERDNRGFGGGRNAAPAMRVPNPDQAPHVANLKARIEELKQRLEGDDPFADKKQPEWESQARAFIGPDVEWQTAKPSGLFAHHGSMLERQPDGSILASGEAPVRDTYDLVFRPGKTKISAIRIEVLPPEGDESGASGRSRKGQFILSGLKLRLQSLSDSQDPPLMFLAKAEADLNQKRPEKPEPDSISPGDIQNSIVADDSKTSGGGGGFRGFGSRGWSIIGDERMERHEAILVPLETLKLNESSVLRLTLEQNSRPYKTLITRFRISFTSEDRVRDVMLTAYGDKWSALGPFPAKDLATAHRTAFALEKDIKVEERLDRKKTYEQPVVEKQDGKKPAQPGSKAPEGKPTEKPASKPVTAKPADEKPATEKPTAGTPTPKGKASGKPTGPKKATAPQEKGGKKQGPSKKGPEKKSAEKKGPAKPGATAKETPKEAPKKPEKKKVELSWKVKETWRDGRRASLSDGDVAWYLTRKLHNNNARVVTMRFDDAPGVKAWLNGELIFQKAPPAQSAQGSRSRGSSPSRGRPSTGSSDREVKVGLRKGESELVVKVVYGKPRSSRGRTGNPSIPGVPPEVLANLSDEEIAELQKQQAQRNPGGGSFTYRMTPEGEDVLNYEIIAALRALPAAEIAATEAAAASGDVAARGGPSDQPAAAAGNDGDAKKRLKKLRDVVRKYYRSNMDTVGKVIAAEKQKLERELRTLEGKMPETMVMKDLEGEKMRKTHMFVRGDYKKKGEAVDAGVPGVLPPMPKNLPRNRLGLARWLVAKDNPLTARVLVNRIWQQYFGKGFVTTPEDFGLRGQLPSHGELLDWLACELVDSGWDLKNLHKLIVMSATYRQDSKVDKAALERDPDNTLLARGPRQRLSAEMVRDNALSASGLMFEKVGGPSVRPYQPPGLWEEVAKGQRYRRDKSENQYRRGLYVYWKRGAPYPSMTTFDAAKREVCTAQRAQTTTPLQALVLLNDPVYVEAARMLGQRMLEKQKDDQERIALGFQLCTSRAPDKAEITVLEELLAQQRKHYKADEKAAAKLLETGDAKADIEKYGAAELAAWTAVGSAMLNMDATIHR